MKHVITEFKPQNTDHCITGSLKQLFHYYNYPVTEAMLFGLGRGISFIYINLQNSPMISGRIKPGLFEENIAKALNITMKIRRPSKYESAEKKLKAEIAANRPVMIYADMAYLPYLNLGESSHFGGHSIVVFGYDDEKQNYYVSDRDSKDFHIHTPKGKIGKDYHLVPYQDMEKSRSSMYKPFPPHSKWLSIDVNGASLITPEILLKAIHENAQEMLYCDGNLLGVTGIEKFSRETLKWKNYSVRKLKTAAITNYFMINRDGGTGGGAFRKMYGDFLIEAAEITGKKVIQQAGEMFHSISDQWDLVADMLMDLSKKSDTSLLKKISKLICKQAEYEKTVFETLLT